MMIYGRSRRTLLVTVVVSCAALGACATVGRPIDRAKYDRVTEGKTTRAEIEAWFGQPDSRTSVTDAEGNILVHYTYAFATSNVFSTSSQTMTIQFDKNDVVAVKKLEIY